MLTMKSIKQGVVVPISGNVRLPVGLCLRADTRSRIESRYPAMFAQYSVEDYTRLLDDTQQGESMFATSPRVTAFWNIVLDAWGANGLEAFNRVTMLALIESFEERAVAHNYPPAVLEQFRISFRRIERNIEHGEPGTYIHTGDNFIKDFSVCRQIAFPGGGAWVIDCHGGFPRRVLFKGGIGQFFRLAYLYLFVTRGNRPFYMPHIHNELTHWHTPEQRLACHARIAQMLERNPQVKGLSGSSWLLDPAVPHISPMLSWVRKIPSENGAWYFRVGEDIGGGALTRSATRRKLYEEGKYTPVAYMNIWPRKKMIAWARGLGNRAFL
jgi:hypothetical protein